MPYIMIDVSDAENTLKVGGVFQQFFPIFWQFQKVGGVTKSHPIDPFIDVIYLFLNVGFGQKVFKFSVFGCHDLRFRYIISYLLPSTQVFYSISLNFSDDLFFSSVQSLKIFPPSKNFFCPKKNLFTPSKTFYTRPKKFLPPIPFFIPPHLFIALPL